MVGTTNPVVAGRGGRHRGSCRWAMLVWGRCVRDGAKEGARDEGAFVA